MRRPPPVRLRAEPLEDRTVPAMFEVTTLADTGTGSLRAAITAANTATSDDTITITVTGTITLGGTQLPAIRGVLAITGPGAGQLTVSGNDQSRVFEVASGATATIAGLTVTGGLTTSDGAGVLNRGALTVRGVTFRDNSADDDGGGIYSRPFSTSLRVEACTFTDNRARRAGAGVSALCPMVLVTGSTFTGNEVVVSGNPSGIGGALYVLGDLDVSDTTFTDNLASQGGGLSFGPNSTTGGDLTVTRCTFTDNTASQGGAFYFTGTAALVDSLLETNHATFAGGGIRSMSGTLTATGTTFRGNTCDISGGAIQLGTSAVTVTATGCAFVGNSADSGGAVSVTDGTLTLVRSVLADNVATSGNGGGGVHNGDGTLTVTDCTLSGNSATGHQGGAIHNGGNLVVTGSTFVDNTARVGGALSNIPTAGTPTRTAVVTNSTFFDNRAVGSTNTSGGGAVWSVGVLTLTSCTLAGNVADTAGVPGGVGGGGLYAGDPVTLVNTLIAGNTTTTAGPDVRGSIVAGSANNLIGNGTGITGITHGTNGNQVGTAPSPIAPLLGSLANNGGPTQTLALLAGSPALDAGGDPGVLATDQRGAGFVRAFGPAADIGAFEDQPAAVVVVSPATLPAGQVGAAYSQTFTAAGTAGPFAFTVTAGTLPGGLTLSSAGVLSGTPTTAATASFTVTAADAAGPTGSRAYQLLVDPAPNTPPTITAVPDQSIPRNGATAALGFTVADAQTPAANLSVTGASSDQSLVPNANVVVTAGAGGARTVTVTPAAGATGTVTITLTVTDADGATATDTFDVVVTAPPPNSPPTITAVPDQSIPQNGATAALGFTVADVQTAAANLGVTGASSDQSLVPNANVVVTAGAGGARTVTVTPAAGATGTVTITLTVTDADGATATDTFDVVVTAPPPNSPPTITAVPDQSIPQNGATAALGFTVADVQTAAANLGVTGASSDQSLVPNANVVVAAGAGGARTVTVTPVAGATGTATITVTVTDPGGLTATETFDVTVTAPPPNTPPTITDVPNQSIPANGTTGDLGFSVGDAQTPAANLSVSATSSNPAVILNGNILISPGAGGARTVSVIPVAGASGTATITLTVSDGALTATDTFDVTVTAPPAPPPQVAVRSLVASGTGGSARVYDADAAGRFGSPDATVNPFNRNTGSVRTAQADVDGDGTPDVVLVTGPGTALRLAVVSGTDRRTVLVAPFDPFGGNFTGGGFVAAADLDADGRAEFLVTADQGGGPRVTIFSFTAAGAAATQRANFLGIDDRDFRGGARAALGDVDGDGTPDLAVGAGFLGGPRVALFDGTTLLGGAPARLINDFFAFPGTDATTLRNGVFVAAGDVDGDGRAELVFGGGPGGAPRVFILGGAELAAGNVSGAQAAPVSNFFVANNSTDRGGVRVATADADGDGRADVYAGSGERSAARVRVYLGKDFAPGGGEPGAFQDVEVLGGGVLTNGVFVG